MRRRSSWQNKILWGLLLFVLAGGGVGGWYFFGRGNSAATQGSTGSEQTQTAVVRRGDIRVSASGSGKLVAGQTAALSFSTNGTLSELHVEVGDMVKAGDVLARLESATDLEANLASAKLALLEAQQRLDDLQQNADLSLALAYQNWLKTQETYNDARAASQKTGSRRCSRDVTARYGAAVDRANERLEAIDPSAKGSDVWINATSEYDTALANYTYCASYTDQEKARAETEMTIAELNLRQAEQEYNTLKEASGIDPDELALVEAQVNEAEKQLTSAQEDLNGIVLSAPFDGKVISLAAGVGETVDTAAFLTIADVAHPMITVSVDENDLDKFKLGSAAVVTFDVLPDQTFIGTVVQLDPQLITSGQYRVVQGLVELDSEAAKIVQDLVLGLNASVEIISAETNDALLVPLAALRDLGDGQYAVMVMGSDGKLRLNPVEVGLRDSSYAEISSGLEMGAVVSTGLTQTKDSTANSTGSLNDENSGMPGGGMPPDGMMPPP